MHRSLLAAALITTSACSSVDAGPPAEGVCGHLQVACGPTCVDFETNDEHCGGCGNACADGTTCEDATCVKACPNQLSLCGGACVDHLEDVENCGACGSRCEAGDNSTVACELGQCAFTCTGDFRDCNGEQSDGCERDVSDDLANCGACDARCLGPPQANGTCVAATCGLGSCFEGFGDCDGFSTNGCEVSLGTSAVHCGSCGNDCASGSACVDGSCELVRPNVLVCGSAQVDVNTFVPSGFSLSVVSSCTPDANTQAMLVTRSGTTSVVPLDAADYVQNGGILISELANGDDLFGMLFSPVTQGLFQGNCSDNIATIVQRSPTDPIWIDNVFIPIDLQSSGCGRDISHFPDIVPLAGWSSSTVSFAYRDRGAGRLWLVEADWQDLTILQNQQTRTLMGYMLLTR